MSITRPPKLKSAFREEIEVPIEYDDEPDMMSGADYAEKYKVNKVCAEAITEFYMYGGKKFKAYAGLKTGGLDYWSNAPRKELEKAAGKGAVDIIKKYFQYDKDIDACLRWKCRGLTLTDAIRKIQVGNEIAQNALKSKNKR